MNPLSCVQVNMDQFEELFKTKAQDSEANRMRLQRFNESRMKRGVNIIDANRARNLCELTLFCLSSFVSGFLAMCRKI